MVGLNLANVSVAWRVDNGLKWDMSQQVGPQTGERRNPMGPIATPSSPTPSRTKPDMTGWGQFGFGVEISNGFAANAPR